LPAAAPNPMPPRLRTGAFSVRAEEMKLLSMKPTNLALLTALLLAPLAALLATRSCFCRRRYSLAPLRMRPGKDWI
jgi:hypothetical protein